VTNCHIRVFEELSTSFITPFDREDVHNLADCLDDVIDRINSCAKRIAIYNPKKNVKEAPDARRTLAKIGASGCSLRTAMAMV
jgi:uncharacterized protein Yka (UPF0111/DUF47 family)